MRKTNRWAVMWSTVIVGIILGILYTWSVIGKGLRTELHWTSTQASLPYTVFTVMMSIGFCVFGRIQEKIGPRICIIVCAIFMGEGLILSAMFTSPLPVAIFFGVVCGAGVGSGSNSSLAAALRWFPASKKGMVSGLALAGVGFSAVLYAPFSSLLLGSLGVSSTFLVFGLISFVFMFILSFNMKNPPRSYDPELGRELSREEFSSAQEAKAALEAEKKSAEAEEDDFIISAPKAVSDNYTTKNMLKSSRFYIIFIVFALTSAAGLMINSHTASIAQIQSGWESGFLLVIVLNIFNTAGRFIGGSLSDKIGRVFTIRLAMAIQAINLLLFRFYSPIPLIIFGIMIQGFCDGTIFASIPSLTSDVFGPKHFGSNFGMMFLAWGIGGVIGPLAAARIFDSSGSYISAYYLAFALTIIAMCLLIIFRLRKPDKTAA